MSAPNISATTTRPTSTPRSSSSRRARYDAARAPDASINSECSVHSSTGRAGPSRPRDMTAIRSQTPSSSGR